MPPLILLSIRRSVRAQAPLASVRKCGSSLGVGQAGCVPARLAAGRQADRGRQKVVSGVRGRGDKERIQAQTFMLNVSAMCGHQISLVLGRPLSRSNNLRVCYSLVLLAFERPRWPGVARGDAPRRYSSRSTSPLWCPPWPLTAPPSAACAGAPSPRARRPGEG